MSTLKRSRCNSRAFDVQRFAGRHICYVIIQTMRATFTVHLKLQPECWGKEATPQPANDRLCVQAPPLTGMSSLC